MKKMILRRLLSVATLGAIAAAGFACSDDEAKQPDPSQKPVEVELDRYLEESGLYFGDFWEEGYGNYYFELASGAVGQTGQTGLAMPVPLNPGDYILALDIWGALSADHAHPLLPEGVYTAATGRADGTFNLENTLAVYNKEQVGEQFRIQYIRFKEGTVTVKHVAAGYDIRAQFETETGEEYLFTYVGGIGLADWSDDEEEAWEIGSDATIAPVTVTKDKWEDPEGDNYYIRCFDTEVTDDGLHCNAPGTKLEICLWVETGADIVGTFTPGERKVPGRFAPGMRFGMGALDTHAERVMPDLSIRYALITGGTLKIARNADDTYTFDADLATKDGFTVKGRWTLPVEEFAQRVSPQTTLTEDVVFHPTQCSEIRYFGDYYETGTSNYTVFLADDDEVIGFDLCAPADDGTVFPTGRFTVADTHAARTMIAGSLASDNATPSCYVRYNTATGAAAAAAPIVGGTLTVTESNGQYTFAYEVYDDYDRADASLRPHKISGSWTGALPKILQGNEGLSAPSAVGRTKRPGKRIALSR